MAKQTITEHGISTRLACEIFQISQTCFRYQTVRGDENILIADWLLRLTSIVD
jgi:putative transposase